MYSSPRGLDQAADGGKSNTEGDMGSKQRNGGRRVHQGRRQNGPHPVSNIWMQATLNGSRGNRLI